MDINGQVQPVNDYDILIIVPDHTTILNERIATIKSRFLKQSLIQRLDIAWLRANELRSLRPTLLNFDRRYGSIVLYGDGDILRDLPAWDSSQIPLREGEKLLFTRLIGFVLLYKYVFLEAGRDENKEFLLRQQLSKAVIAAADVRLMILNKYTTSYADRAKEVGFLDIFSIEERQLIQSGFDFKLRPSISFSLDKTGYYCNVLQFYLKQFDFFARHIYTRRYTSLEKYDIPFLFDFRRLMILTYQTVSGKSSFRKSMFLCLSQLFFTLSVDVHGSGRCDKKLLDKSCYYSRLLGASPQMNVGSLIDFILINRL